MPNVETFTATPLRDGEEYQPLTLVEPEERQEYSPRVWRRIIQTYKEYGNSEDGRLYGANMTDLVETPGAWKLIVQGEEVVAGVIYRRYKGLKMRLVFHDCTRVGKDKLKELFLGEFHKHACWAEASGHLEHILWEHHVRPIPNAYAERLLEKEVLWYDDDGYHYERDVHAGTVKREMLFGWPNEAQP